MPMTMLREYGSTPRFHGNGFTQLPLRDDRRLHVWHPSLPPIPGHNATIHNHVWDMQSRILMGRLTHRTISIIRSHRDLGSHEMFSAHQDLGHVGYCVATITGEYHLYAGSVYVFPAGEFHESEAKTTTVTIMERRRTERAVGRGPLVLATIGEPPTDAFAPEHQPSLDAMWAVIEEAVMSMGTHARLELKTCLE